MIAALFKLFGFGGLPQWAMEAILIAGLAASALVAFKVHDHNVATAAAAHELAALKDSSDKLTKAADAKIAATTADQAKKDEENATIRSAALATNSALSTQLDGVRNSFNAYRTSHPDVARPASGSGPAGGGECGAQSCGDLASQLLQNADELARSNADLATVLQSCQRNRDQLNGLPQ